MATQIGSESVIGRDKLITTIWKRLEKKSLQFTAERRIGKTTIMRKLESEPIHGMSLSYIDLEKVDSINRFIEVLLNDLRPLLTKKFKSKAKFSDFLNYIGGAEVGGIIKIPENHSDNWKSTLEKILEDICRQDEQIKLVLMFDELPYMLQRIATNAEEDRQKALSLLDILRAARDTHELSLRMIFTGSIGLHHILTYLKDDKYASQPFNDMLKIEVPPLTHNDSIVLAKRLLEEEAVHILHNELDVLADDIVELTDCFPFYIEQVIFRLSEFESPVTRDIAAQIVQECLTDDKDVWEMEHFRSRLRIYYRGSLTDIQGKKIEKSKLAATILNFVSICENPVSINEVWSGVKAEFPLDDRDNIIQLLKSLTLDNYLSCNTDKEYQFKFNLIKKWWILAQGLSK